MAARLAGPRIPAGGVGLAIRAWMTRSAWCRRRARKQSGRHDPAASWPAARRSKDPELPGAADGLAAVGHRQLAVDALEMALDGVDRDEQHGGDLHGVEHLGRVLEHLTLAAAERLEHDRCRARTRPRRSEEHTSELQSPVHLVC